MPAVLLLSAVSSAVIVALAFFFLYPFAPPEAMSLASRFIADLQNGRINDAYELTDRGGDVGTNVLVFAANEDVLFLSSSRYPISLEWVRPMQSRAQRIARIIRRARADPDILYVSFYVGLPFLLRLRHTQQGWAISYFEVHAE
jgi:hypothetical protein